MKSLIVFSLFSFIVSGEPKAVEFESGEKKVRLLELYTSQSCSSCPPAESWLNDLKKTSGLWKSFVPVSYHVAYWNHLHWVDSFSKEEFSQRQREYHRVIRGGVYTPQFVLDGKDFRRWRRGASLSSSEKSGNLKVSYDTSSMKAKIDYRLEKGSRDLICYGAYLESGHPVKVLRGENRGRTILQDFIALDLRQKKAVRGKSNYECEIELKTTQANDKFEHSVAFWLVDAKTYEVVQATGGKI